MKTTELKQRLRETSRHYLRTGFKNGFFHVIGGNTLVKIISFVSSFLVLHILSTQQYGLFTQPDNIVNIVLLFNGLGMSTAMLYYCTIMDDESEKKAYFKFALRFGLVFDVILIVLAATVLCALNWLPIIFHQKSIYPITGEEAQLLIFLALIPFLAFAFEMIQFFLRAERDNRNFSKTSVIFTACYGIFQVMFVLLLKVYGFVAGRYLAYAVAIVVGITLLRKKPAMKAAAVTLGRNDKISIIRFAASAMTANCFSVIMPYIETLIVYYFVSNFTLRAEFSVAWLPPQSIQFLTSAVMVYMFPFFARNYKDGRWLRSNSKKLYITLFVVMTVIVIGGILLTPVIIRSFIGIQYYNAQEIRMMRVFWVAFGVNCALKTPTANILSAIGQIRFNTVNSILSTLVQTVICWVLISRFGLNGAAYGLLCGYILSSVGGIVYLRYYCKRLIKRHETNVPEVEIEDQV